MTAKPRRATQATLKQVARAAGVSPMTVSRALHNPDQVAAATCARVLKACRRLNYRPNVSARTLRTRISHHVGVLVPDLKNTFWIDVLSGVEQVITEAGFDLLIGNSNEDPARMVTSVDTMVSRAVDGLLLAPTVGSAALIQGLHQEGQPLVLLDRRLAGLESLSCVVIDNEAGAYAATRHLMEVGHTRIGLLAGNINLDTGRQRLNGFRRALRKARRPISANDIRSAKTNAALVGRQVGYQGTLEFINRRDRPTAILCTSSTIAVGALSALQEQHVQIPGQMALVTFGNPDWTLLVDPPLTVVTQPTVEMGRQAARILIEALRGGRENGTAEAEAHAAAHIILQPELLIRASSAYPDGAEARMASDRRRTH